MIGDIKKFRFWCQKVLPLVYDNSLSYYEVLCKVVQYLNGLIDDVNKIPEYIDSVIDERLDDEHLKELILEVNRMIEDAISKSNEGDNTNSSKDYAIGAWLWLNGTLYKAKRAIDAGDTFIVDTNIEAISVEECIDALLTFIENEVTARENADTTLQGNIDAEATARENADTTLQGNIDAEATTRENADTRLEGLIETEATARKNADNELRGLITNTDKFISPYDFGAVGDGVTDDTKAFQDMLANNSKPIIINKGSFLITGTLDVPSNCTILGCKESIILDNVAVGSASAYSKVFNIYNASNVTIDGINIKGYNEVITGGSSQFKKAISIEDSDYVKITNCHLTYIDAQYAIVAKNSNYIDIIENTINHYNYIAIELLILCTNVRIINNTVMNCDNYTYDAKGQNYGIDFSGFDSALSSGAPMNENILVDGNYVYQTHGTWEGIGGHGGHRVTIVNNKIVNTYSGICVDTSSTKNYNASDIIIANNYIQLTTENYVGNVVKHNECILIGGVNFSIHDNICKNGGWAGSLVSTFDDPTAIGIVGVTNADIYNNLVYTSRGNIFKLKLDCLKVTIHDNSLYYLYWETPYGSYKACVYNIHDVTSLNWLDIYNNHLNHYEANDWYIYGKNGSAISAYGVADPYIKIHDDIIETSRALVNQYADNIITNMVDITNVLMGKVGDRIVNTNASTTGDVIEWLCTKKWIAGASGVWSPVATIA